ncbi:MAG: alpha/beta fold hydrolase, partial [Sutterella sp.]|nr:alpha/beta fold hydrolase [Sutterella sp.]
MTDFCVQEIGPSPFIPGFALFDAHLGNSIVIRFARAGQGVPLLMVHGHPHNHVIWRKVAPTLAEHYTVILPDLRGYGD